jgi:hypothetical protein
VGDDYLVAVLTFAGDGQELPVDTIPLHLREIDNALDELFAKFSKIIKHVTVLQVCSILRLEPPTLGNSLFWMVEELRSTLWKV